MLAVNDVSPPPRKLSKRSSSPDLLVLAKRQKEEDVRGPTKLLPPPPVLKPTSPHNAAASIIRYRSRPELMTWRQRANDQRSAAVTLDALSSAMHLQKRSLECHRTNAINMFILLLVSCPDLVDAQVVALAVKYLDKYTCTKDAGNDYDDDFQASSCSVPMTPNNSSPPAPRKFLYYHTAAACIALALKWERDSADYRLVGSPKQNPLCFNRLIELFQTSNNTRLTPTLLSKIQVDVCAVLQYDMWISTPTEWMVMVRNTYPASYVETPLAFSTDPMNYEEYPSPCWLRRDRTPLGADQLPSRLETAAALKRLPLEEQVLLHALREPTLAEWTPCRLATASMALTTCCSVLAINADVRTVALAELETARRATMPNCDKTDAYIVHTVRSHRSTIKDAAILLNLFNLRSRKEGVEKYSAWIADRIPALAQLVQAEAVLAPYVAVLPL